MVNDPVLRTLSLDDRTDYARMLHRAFNTWYAARGWPSDYFRCSPDQAGIFLDIYEDISPGRNVAAFDPQSGAMMGACFYHPREHHVSLGIMAVNPDFFRRGVGRQLVNHIIGFTESGRYPALRLIGSAMNMDSFSLYNRAGFIPRGGYHDMVLPVPASGLHVHYPLRDHVRGATLAVGMPWQHWKWISAALPVTATTAMPSKIREGRCTPWSTKVMTVPLTAA